MWRSCRSIMSLFSSTSPRAALLRDSRKEMHVLIAQQLVESATEEEALARTLAVEAAGPPAAAEGEELTVASDQVSG